MQFISALAIFMVAPHGTLSEAATAGQEGKYMVVSSLLDALARL